MKLVIFDLDGTLYRSTETAIPAILAALADLKQPLPPDEMLIPLFGDPLDVLCAKLLPKGDACQREVLADKIKYYERKLIPNEGKLFDGIPELIDGLLSLNYTLAICSNGSAGYIDAVLEAFGLSGKFQYVKKRNPLKDKAALVKEILEEAGVQEAIVVGDSWYDIDAARRNHLVNIGVTYGYGGQEVYKADYTADNAQEILEHILRCSV